jgi:hypothetical protein
MAGDSRVNLDWKRMKAVVLESDDWGLCAWAPDSQAYRVLSDLPVFRSPIGRRYGGSTLERASDVKRIAGVLSEFRGGDGFPPILQANTVMGAPDYARLQPPAFACDELPIIGLPLTPSRWARHGLWGEIVAAREAGVWWPELHGLHHLPETVWLKALRTGVLDARRAFEQQSPVCEAVVGSGEYDPREPLELRVRNLEHAVQRFQQLVGRPPESFCPPNYRADERIENEAERLGVRTFQGRPERPGGGWLRLRHYLERYRFPDVRGARFYLPPRIAFEPGAEGGELTMVGVAGALRGVRAAWSRAQPAIVSTHRANYVQLDESRGEACVERLREFLAALASDGAIFLTDAEVHSLVERRWSMRPIGARGALIRHWGVPGEPLRFQAPPGVERVAVREGQGEGVRAVVEGGEVELRCNIGEVLIEWRRE